MNKKQVEDLNEAQKTAHRIVNVIKKIEASRKEGMVHRHAEYKDKLREERGKLEKLIDSVCQ